MVSVSDMIKAMADRGPTFTTGTVKAVDEATLSVDVQPDDGGEVVADVPLRVMRYENVVGFAVVPAVGTEVIVAWLAPGVRPTVIQVQKWTKVLCLNGAGFGLRIADGGAKLGKATFGVKTTSSCVNLGTTADAIHPVAWADNVETRLAALDAAVNDLADHNHNYFKPTGGSVIAATGPPDSSSTVPGTPAVASDEVFTS